jgi:hypothetical protein
MTPAVVAADSTDTPLDLGDIVLEHGQGAGHSHHRQEYRANKTRAEKEIQE